MSDSEPEPQTVGRRVPVFTREEWHKDSALTLARFVYFHGWGVADVTFKLVGWLLIVGVVQTLYVRTQVHELRVLVLVLKYLWLAVVYSGGFILADRAISNMMSSYRSTNRRWVIRITLAVGWFMIAFVLQAYFWPEVIRVADLVLEPPMKP